MLSFELEQKLNDKIAAAYLVVGDDAFLKYEAQKLFEGLVEPTMAELNKDYLPNNASISQIINAYMHEPIMSDRRVIFVKDYNVKLSDEDGNTLKSLISGNKDSGNVLVIVAGSANDKVTGTIPREVFQLVECNHPDEQKARELTEGWCADRGYGIDPRALLKLVAYTGRDMMRIRSELDKLYSYCDSKCIKEDDIEQIVYKDADFAVYELSNALADRQNEKAKEILDKLLQTLAPSYLLRVITTQYRRMLHCLLNKGKTDELTQKLAVKEYAVKRLTLVAGKYTQSKLKKITDKLIDLEYNFKSGKISDSAALGIGFFNALTVA